MSEEPIYVVTEDDGHAGRMRKHKNLYVTHDPKQAQEACDKKYCQGAMTFIEVWEPGSEEPEYVSRDLPEQEFERGDDE